ncbi:hypothetical protein HYV86_05960 [Candidatus Woesearchaeota archaeon]|nr:hypothetical protein [Candidatus Woesearchaeota archaeon]
MNRKVNKKGMEAWHLILMILGLAFLIFVIVWFAVLGGDLTDLLGGLGDLL